MSTSPLSNSPSRRTGLSGAVDVPVRALDRAIALALAVAYLVLLLATMDSGYTRDESFYFRYGQVYQNWFTALAEDAEQGEWGRSLAREPVVDTWRQNLEHPPLMKVLFGWSWALLGEKVRPIGAVKTAAGDGPGATPGATVDVTRLARSEGFQEGASVLLLPPRAVGEPRLSAVALTGTVVDRKARRARVRLDASAEEVAAYSALCASKPGAGEPRMRGCAAVEDRALATLTEGEAVRFPGMLAGALLIALVYLFGVRFGGRWVAGFATLAFAFLPRGFFHSHLACFDVPVTLMTVLILYAFWRSERSRAWAFVAAFCWGLGLLTKLNTFFLPVFLVFYWLLAGRHRFGLAPPVGARWSWPGVAVGLALAAVLGFLLGAAGVVLGLLVIPAVLGWRVRLPRVPLAFVLMPPIGLAMLFLLWPKLWYDPFRSFRDYVAFHLNHDHYMQYYFGRPLEVPPFPVAYPFVMTALTVPVLTLMAFFTGSVVVWGRAALDTARAGWRWACQVVGRGAGGASTGGGAELSDTEIHGRRVRAFLAVNLLFPIVLIAMPNTPIFGGVKHWHTAMPFFAIVAGFGFEWARKRLVAGFGATGRLRPALVGVVLAAALLAPAVYQTLRAHPFGTAYYNELVGGPQGAAELRMHRQFWGYASRQALDRLNREAPHGARVFFQNTTHDAFVMYRRDGLIREDIRFAGDASRADYALFHHQKSFALLEMQLQKDMGALGPAWQVQADGVPMLSVYRKGTP